MPTYHVTLLNDDGVVLALCPAFPEVASVGDTEAEALENVIEAIEPAIEYRLKDGEPMPEPASPGAHGHQVTASVQ